MSENNVAFIFDLDGVIVDTAHFHYLAWKETAKKMDFDLTEVHNEGLKGISRKKSLEKLLSWANKSVSQEIKDVWLEQKNNLYLNYARNLNAGDLLPGVADFVEKLKKKNIPTAIGSASKNAKTILKYLGVIDWFPVIVDGNDVTKSKPDPEVFIIASNRMEKIPSECIVIEDSSAGITAAKSIGMKTIGIGSPEKLGEADIVLANLSLLSDQSFQDLLSSN